jgi:DNA-binding MarR family transcriptional regulator
MSEGTLLLEQFLPYRLSVLTNRISSALSAHYAEQFNLTIPEWRVMAILGPAPGLTASEIGERSAMDKVQVSRAVARLMKAKRLTRRIDRLDRRRATLDLSPAGRAIYASIIPLARSFEAQLLAPFDLKERDALWALVRRLDEVALGYVSPPGKDDIAAREMSRG